jgi:hypothetical protein
MSHLHCSALYRTNTRTLTGDMMTFNAVLKVLALVGLVSVCTIFTLRNAVAESVTIGDNSGGTIADFAISTAQYRNDGTRISFTGQCDSACTLFLSLPTAQTCVSHGATFRFHAPFGVSPRAQATATAYLLRSYPNWVRNWIAQKHGLTRELLTMDYAFASKFMRSCDAVASR